MTGIALWLALTALGLGYECEELADTYEAVQEGDRDLEGAQEALYDFLDVDLLTMPLREWPYEERREIARRRAVVRSLKHLRAEAAIGYNSQARGVSRDLLALCGFPLRVTTKGPYDMGTNKNFAPTNCL